MRLHDDAAFRELVFPEELPMDADAVGEAEGDGPATCDRPPSDQDSPFQRTGRQALAHEPHCRGMIIWERSARAPSACGGGRELALVRSPDAGSHLEVDALLVGNHESSVELADPVIEPGRSACLEANGLIEVTDPIETVIAELARGV
jgi:hypothetical protein